MTVEFLNIMPLKSFDILAPKTHGISFKAETYEIAALVSFAISNGIYGVQVSRCQTVVVKPNGADNRSLSDLFRTYFKKEMAPYAHRNKIYLVAALKSFTLEKKTKNGVRIVNTALSAASTIEKSGVFISDGRG